MARTISLIEEKDWEAISALLLALLAYPDDAQCEQRARVGFKIHGQLVELLLDEGVLAPEELTPRQREALAFMMTARFGPRTESLVRNSVCAGTNALRAVYGESVRLPPAVRHGGIEDIGAWLAGEQQMDRRNYHARIWVSTRPVLALATAFCKMLVDRGETGIEGRLLYLCVDKTFVRQWVEEANRIARIVDACCYTRSKPYEQPHFLWLRADAQNMTASFCIPA